MRLIDADALAEKKFQERECNGLGEGPAYRQGWNDAIDAVMDNEPSAQPEIIRCKDCRYYQDNNDGYPHINCKWDANETPDADDFCSGAERRTDEYDKQTN